MSKSGRFKSEHYAEGEKLTYASMQGNQLSVALPAWMKQKVRDEANAREISISRYVIDMLKKEWEEDQKKKK
mgnify:CR=1 FL=1